MRTDFRTFFANPDNRFYPKRFDTPAKQRNFVLTLKHIADYGIAIDVEVLYEEACGLYLTFPEMVYFNATRVILQLRADGFWDFHPRTIHLTWFDFDGSVPL